MARSGGASAFREGDSTVIENLANHRAIVMVIELSTLTTFYVGPFGATGGVDGAGVPRPGQDLLNQGPLFYKVVGYMPQTN